MELIKQQYTCWVKLRLKVSVHQLLNATVVIEEDHPRDSIKEVVFLSFLVLYCETPRYIREP